MAAERNDRGIKAGQHTAGRLVVLVTQQLNADWGNSQLGSCVQVKGLTLTQWGRTHKHGNDRIYGLAIDKTVLEVAPMAFVTTDQDTEG